jgi:hypothetical protein
VSLRWRSERGSDPQAVGTYALSLRWINVIRVPASEDESEIHAGVEVETPTSLSA